MYGHDSLHTGRVDAPPIERPRVKWSKKLGNRIFAGAAIDEDGTVYVPVEGERFDSSGHALVALTPGGEEKWTIDLPAPVRTTPLIGDQALFFGSYDGSFRSVSFLGERLWQTEPEDLSHRISLSSPAMAKDGTVYYGDHGGWLRAISSDGTPLWSFPTEEYIRAAPAIGEDGTIYFGSYDGVFYALNPDGSVKWSYATGANIDSPAAIAPDGTIYFGSSNAQVYALNPDGTEKWVSDKLVKGSQFFTSPALGHDGTLYVGTNGMTPVGTSQSLQEASYPLIALSPDGDTRWEFSVPHWIRSAPAVVSDGTIYFGSWDGNLYALSAEGEFKWKVSLGEVAVEQAIEASPAVAPDGTIYVGTWDGRFFAIGEDDQE